jgi:hypothetical protein
MPNRLKDGIQVWPWPCNAFLPFKPYQKSEKVRQVGSTWTGWKSNRHYEVCSLLLLHNKNELFLDRTVMCDKKCILYDNFWRSSQRLLYNEAPKHFWMSKFCQKKLMVSGGLPLVSSTTTSWIQARLLWSTVNKLMKFTKSFAKNCQH